MKNKEKNNIFYRNPEFLIPCFWEYGYRYDSLSRHCHLNKGFIEKRIAEIKKYPTELLDHVEEGRKKYFEEKAARKVQDKETMMFYEDNRSEEMMVDYTENIEADINFFSESLMASTLAMALSTFENLLGNISKDIAKNLNVEVELPKNPMPYNSKYLIEKKRMMTFWTN